MLHPATDNPIRIRVAQRAVTSGPKTATESTDIRDVRAGFQPRYIDIVGYDPEGKPVTLRTSAFKNVEIPTLNYETITTPTVEFLAPIELTYLNKDDVEMTDDEARRLIEEAFDEFTQAAVEWVNGLGASLLKWLER